MSSSYQSHMLYHQLRNGCSPLPFEVNFSQAPALYDEDYEVLDSARSGPNVLASPSTAVTPVSVNESGFSSEVSFKSPWKSVLPQMENRSPRALDDEQMESQEEFESYMAAVMCEYGAPADVVSDFSLTRPIIPSAESEIHGANIEQVMELEEVRSANTVGTIGTLGMVSPSLGISTPPLTSAKINSADGSRQHRIVAVVNADDEMAVREHSNNPHAHFVSNITVGMVLQPEFTSRNDETTAASSSSAPMSTTRHANTAASYEASGSEHSMPRTVATTTQALSFSDKKVFISQEQRQRAGVPSDVFWTVDKSDMMQGQKVFRRDDLDTPEYTLNSTTGPCNQSRESYNMQEQGRTSDNAITEAVSVDAKNLPKNGSTAAKISNENSDFLQKINNKLRKKQSEPVICTENDAPVNAHDLASRLQQVKKERMDVDEGSEDHPYFAQPNPQYEQYKSLKIENSQDISSNSNDVQWTRRDGMKDMFKRTGKRLKGKFQRRNSEDGK